jgi:hypothetical protein
MAKKEKERKDELKRKEEEEKAKAATEALEEAKKKPLSDDTVVGDAKWAKLKVDALKSGYTSQDWYNKLSEPEKVLLERLIVAQNA